ncbi:MAG: phosphoenolpyruvate--protein phosphotransferase [Planctomycetes bacterium]|nr:phosphoenolpyruvate--protein phosphotransferase [Planctomycetota bacterium]MCG2684102.1 phosphoenolpyruvate--protein phosphotransferase [Planctomycetales bacterium]
MQKLQGIAVSPGAVIGEALVMDTEGFRIPRRFVARDAVVDELERFNKAVTAAAVEIAHHRETVSAELGEKYGAIFEAHLQMLQDSRLRGEVEELIRQRHYSPEYAVSHVLRRYAQVFQRLESSYLAERANDIFDIEKRLLRHLLGRRREGISHLTSPVLVLAHNLTPSETSNLDRRFVRGFVTEVGGPGSHTAIVAEALEIPAVVGTGPFLTDVSGGETVIIDGDQGLVILQPDEETLARYRREAEEKRIQATKLEPLRDLPAETRDGVRIELLGNIEFPYEVDHCVDRGADGVGLYRTEFLYLGAEIEPTEEIHYQAYTRVVQAMGNKPVVIRTFDLGADKMPNMPHPEDNRNPCLGLRSIRLALRNLPVFRTQLRAILRASVLGKVHVMFPLVSTLLELRQAKMVLADVMEDLQEHNLPFDRNMPVGMMVETPAAAMMADRFVEEVDFLSIGTNDLIQYTLAVDRTNKDVVGLYNPVDPAVLKLVAMAIEAADRKPVPISMCGQMSGSPLYTILLLGMGLRRFSVTPSAIPEVKNLCRRVTIPECRTVAERVMTMENARDVKNYLKEEVKKYVEEVAE